MAEDDVKKKMIEEFADLLSWYGGVQDYEFNMGTFGGQTNMVEPLL